MGPAAILFVSANIANAANLLFNMIFARLMAPALFADLTLLLTLKLGVLSFLGALQFAFAEQSAKERHGPTSKIKAYALSWRSLKICPDYVCHYRFSRPPILLAEFFIALGFSRAGAGHSILPSYGHLPRIDPRSDSGP